MSVERGQLLPAGVGDFALEGEAGAAFLPAASTRVINRYR